MLFKRDPVPSETKLGRAIQVKAEEVLEDGTFTGYGSVFNVQDRGWDIVMPGAFGASLAEHKSNGSMPLLLWQHDPSTVIGKWLEAYEDGHGLYLKGQLITEVQKGREAHVLLKRGALSGLSIGYDCLAWEIEQTEQGSDPYGPCIRRIKEAELWEVSIVTFPMCTEARIETVKRDQDAWRRAVAPDHRKELAGLARAVQAREQILRGLQLQ